MMRAMKKSSHNTNLVPFQVRVPADIAIAIRVEAARHELNHGDLVHQMFIFAKRNGFFDALKGKA